MIFGKRAPYIYIFVLLFFLLSCQIVENFAYTRQQRVEYIDNTGTDMFEKDPLIKLLGKSFDEIKQVLGEPDEHGYSEWLGPHYYILFRNKKGAVRFCSPEPMENKIAVSIILGPGQEVLGVKVGMSFLEIKDILGTPSSGPDLSMDNQYYMDYFLGETGNQIPEIFLSFIADAVDSRTQEAFIKWEGFEYDQMEMKSGGKFTAGF